MFVNGILFLIEKTHLLDIANAISLRNVASSIENTHIQYFNASDSATILISNIMYEKDFKSVSPINKEKLSQVLNQIISKEPSTLIIDLDISPDYDFSKNNQISIHHDIYKLLIDNSANINIILPFAFYSKTIENKLLKKEWLTYMCNNNIHFGLPSISSEMGIALQYFDYKNSMYNLAKGTNNIICQNILKSNEDIYTLLEQYQQEYKNTKQYPINFKNINSHSIFIDEINDLEDYNFKNKTIFLGGAYGYGDKYITPYGEKYGVQIHESIFHSLSHKINHANVILTLLADFLLAITFGLLLEKLLHSRNNSNNLNTLAFLNLILFTVLIIFVIASAVISTLMYHNFYIWLNPIPLIVGMFLDSIVGLSQKKNLNTSIRNIKNSFHYLLVLCFIGMGIWSILSTVLNF